MSCPLNLGTGQAPGVVNQASDPLWKSFDPVGDVFTGAVLVGNPVWGAAPAGLHWIATHPGFGSGANQYTGGDYTFQALFDGDEGILTFRVKADNAVKVYLNGVLILTWGDNTGVSSAGWNTFSPLQIVTTGFLDVNTLDLVVHNNVGTTGTSYMGVLLEGGFDRSCGNPALIQSTFGTKGNFELVVPHPGGGISHYYRDNDKPSLPWMGPTAVFAAPQKVGGVSMIQSSFNNLEVIARIGHALAHFYRDSSSGVWMGGQFFAFGISGTPSLIQNLAGNFEVVVALTTGGLARFYRDNSAPTFPWSGASGVATAAAQAVSVIQSSYGGNLEVVARIGSQLAHFYRDANSGNWSGPDFFASGVSGTPSFIQSKIGAPGNFEVVTPLASGGMGHFWRENSHPAMPWHGPNQFGNGSVDGVDLIQSNYGYNLEVVATVDCNRVSHYYRDGLGNWSGPAVIVP